MYVCHQQSAAYGSNGSSSDIWNFLCCLVVALASPNVYLLFCEILLTGYDSTSQLSQSFVNVFWQKSIVHEEE